MITKDRIALFLGGVMLMGSMEIAFYGVEFYVAAVLLIVGVLFLLCGYSMNQQRYDVIPILEKELQSLKQEMTKLKSIAEKSPKQEDASVIIEEMATLVKLSRDSRESIEKILPLTDGGVNKLHREIVELKTIIEDIPKRSDLEKLIDEFSVFSSFPSEIDNSLKKFLTETQKINDLTHEGQKSILDDTRKNNQELIESCRNTIDDAVSKMRFELSKVIDDADIMKNDYLKANNSLIEKQANIAEKTGENIVLIGQDIENKMNIILTNIEGFRDDTTEQISALGKELNENVNNLCDDIRESMEDLDDNIKKKHTKLVGKLSDDIGSMTQNISDLAQSYEEFKKHNDALIQAFTQMSEEDAKIIKSILPK